MARTHVADHAGQDERGRAAKSPREIPARGWKDVLLRVKDELNRDNASLVAAGVAFYFLLALFPALAAVVSIYGLVADPAQVQQQLEAMSGALPQEAQALIREQLTSVASGATGALSFGAIGGLLLTIWSSAKGVKALIEAMNISYDQRESRGFIKLNLIALALTLAAILFVVVTVGLVVALPALLGNLGLGDAARTAISIGRWPLLAIVVMLYLALLYRYGPDRDEPRWQWVSWGAVLAAVIWLIGSGLFSWYVSNFGNYNKTYGTAGAVVILLMWFWLTAYIIMLGAELNSEMEHQTKEDTTEGRTRPMGQRRAYVADTVGEQR